MSRRKRARGRLVGWTNRAGLALLALPLTVLAAGPLGIRLNVSTSLPPGLYRVVGAPIEVGSVQVAADGTFATAVMAAQNAQPGKYTVAVSQADGDEATATVTVTRAGGIGGIIGGILDWLWDLINGWF